jgi:hypothetical protein
MQAQLIGINVVALGAILSVAVQGENGSVVLVYPLISLMLGISWLNHAHSILRTSTFIARSMEEHLREEDRWENYLRTLEPTNFNRISYWGVRSAFPIGSILALVAGLLIGIEGRLAWVAFAISCTIAIATVAIFAFLRENSHEIASPDSNFKGGPSS